MKEIEDIRPRFKSHNTIKNLFQFGGRDWFRAVHLFGISPCSSQAEPLYCAISSSQNIDVLIGQE